MSYMAVPALPACNAKTVRLKLEFDKQVNQNWKPASIKTLNGSVTQDSIQH